ncbi:NACHT, LRR and PYD domains-containing protein 1 homolog [Salminus brasiliensis]|uniref:NACHT, LRR and PYD domains-containing protein 1 homolog n=1 Tax=Salminus brasiliensis TaxID=930266 RepID=UPI003B837ED9
MGSCSSKSVKKDEEGEDLGGSVWSKKEIHSKSVSQRKHQSDWFELQGPSGWFCSFCSHVENSTGWKLIEPDRTSLVDGTVKYRIMVTPGRYQCRVTGLRWENSCPAELEYCLGDWDHFSEFLEKEGFIPCGPLMDIKVILGELAAVHLPHFLCLGFHQWSEVRVLREENTGVSSEICEVSRFHALLPNPTFMPNGVLVRSGFPVKAHCDVLIYRTSAAHLTLHVYLVPWDLKMKESVEKREKGSVKISRPGTNVPLQIKKHYIISTSCFSEITPRKLKFRYTSKAPKFFKLYIKDAENYIFLNLMTEEKKSVWTAYLRPDEISRKPSDVDVMEGPFFSPALTRTVWKECKAPMVKMEGVMEAMSKTAPDQTEEIDSPESSRNFCTSCSSFQDYKVQA